MRPVATDSFLQLNFSFLSIFDGFWQQYLPKYRPCVEAQRHLDWSYNLETNLCSTIEVVTDISTSSFVIIIAKAISNLHFFFIYVLYVLFLIALLILALFKSKHLSFLVYVSFCRKHFYIRMDA